MLEYKFLVSDDHFFIYTIAIIVYKWALELYEISSLN